MKTANYKSIGVIVSRFQVPFLTEGHKSLLDMVSANHGRVIVVLGVSQSTPSSLNPLDFATRAAMVQSAYPEVLVLPLQDYSQDSVWSDNLETLLKSVYATSSFHLYSGRDGFNIAYTGNRPITIVDSVESITGTEIRTEVSSSIKNDYNFRSGVIYGVTNRYPHVNTTVDIAIVKNNETLIVGRKSGETKYQFIGGFVNVNETLEDAAVRETFEETTVEIHRNPIYIGSFPVDDWRYQGTSDSILTTFFQGEYFCGAIQASDDIEELIQIPLNKIQIYKFRDIHKPLVKMFLNFRDINEYKVNGNYDDGNSFS